MGGKGLEGLALSFAQSFKDAGQPRELGVVRGCLAGTRDLITLGSELVFAHGAPEGCVLVILDQLEEVFGTPEGSEARTALRLIVGGERRWQRFDHHSRHHALGFLECFSAIRGGGQALRGGHPRPHGPLALQQVIEGPADRFGLDIDAGLSERMVQDTADNDALPLLAFTLEKLYERCKPQGSLTVKAYDELGGVSAAIKHAADAILEEAGYAGLPADDPRMRDLRRAFYSLAQVGEEGQFTKRTAPWSQMPASCEAILKRFVAERLLVSGAHNGQPILSVAHEALFRVWDTLAAGYARTARRSRSGPRSRIRPPNGRPRIGRSRAWTEERILDAVRAIGKSGVSLANVKDRATVAAFSGQPTRRRSKRCLPSRPKRIAARGSGPTATLGVCRLATRRGRARACGWHCSATAARGVGLRADGLPDIDWRGIDGGNVTIEVRANPNDPNSEVEKRLTLFCEPILDGALSDHHCPVPRVP